MTRAEIEDKVTEIVEPLLTGTGVELVDVEYVQEKDWYLRIFIDKAEGIGIEDCEQVSRLVEPVLDEVNFLNQAYYLEVSSPGLDRALRRDRDYARYAGRLVDIKFFRPQSGKKEYTATLQGLDDGHLCVAMDGQEYRFPMGDVAQVRLHISFGKGKK